MGTVPPEAWQNPMHAGRRPEGLDRLGRCCASCWQGLSIFPTTSTLADQKHVFWADNPLGDQLHKVLLALASAGVLDRRDEPDEQFRWVMTRSDGAPVVPPDGTEQPSTPPDR